MANLPYFWSRTANCSLRTVAEVCRSKPSPLIFSSPVSKSGRKRSLFTTGFKESCRISKNASSAGVLSTRNYSTIQLACVTMFKSRPLLRPRTVRYLSSSAVHTSTSTSTFAHRWGRRLILAVGGIYGLLALIPTCFTGMAAYHWITNGPHQYVRGYSFYATTGFLCLPLSLILLASAPFVLLFDGDQRLFFNSIQHLWGYLTCYPFLKPKVIGLEKLPKVGEQPVVYVSNHQSWLDIYALLWLGVPLKFVSKQEIFYIPVVGWCMGLIGHISLSRGDKKSGKGVVYKCIENIKKGVSVFFFPEGTRTRDGNIQPLKIGAFVVANKTNAPIVPIHIEGTSELMPTDTAFWLDEDKGNIKITVHDWIMPANSTDTAEKLRDKTFAVFSKLK